MSDIIERSYSKFVENVESRNLFQEVEQFLILFSCGKDCSMMLDLFLRYHQERDLQIPFTVFCALFPKHMYFLHDEEPNDNFLDIQHYWKSRGVEIQYRVPEFEDFDDNDRNGCKICKKSRKSVIDAFVNSYAGHLGIATGFTMYDALSYLTMLLLTCNYNISYLSSLSEPLRSTTSKMLHKMSLRECLPNGKYMIRPMLPFHEQEVKEYLDAREIPFLTTECKISNYKFKRLYSDALDLFLEFPVTYNGIEAFLETQGIRLNNGGLSFADVENDNYFIDC